MIGGAFLCYEGVEKLAHKLLHGKAEDEAHEAELAQALADPRSTCARSRRTRSGARCAPTSSSRPRSSSSRWGRWRARTFVTQVLVLTAIAVVMTVGVYGLVAGIVKLDDVGLYLSRRSGETALPDATRPGRAILAGAPWLMKGLSVAGTAAMFLVGGGIFVHGIPPLHHTFERLADGVAEVPAVGDTLR